MPKSRSGRGKAKANPSSLPPPPPPPPLPTASSGQAVTDGAAASSKADAGGLSTTTEGSEDPWPALRGCSDSGRALPDTGTRPAAGMQDGGCASYSDVAAGLVETVTLPEIDIVDEVPLDATDDTE